MADEKKYIEREAALRACDAADAPYAKRIVSYCSTADVRPVVRGRWVYIEGFPACEHCGASPAYCEPKSNNEQGYPPFCHECGADMRPKEESYESP